jgi:asparagine synthase (glutamine-hydrolysing)
VIPHLPEIYDEPFADSSQIPTFLVAQLARKHVVVSLSGDGGDELFGGYGRYFTADRYLRTIRHQVRAWWKVLVRAFRHEAGRGLGDERYSFGARVKSEVYLELISHWRKPSALALEAPNEEHSVVNPALILPGIDWFSQMMFWDTLTYLPDDILVKVDRATMAVSLESRAPMLDHRLIEFVWTLPVAMKVREGRGKWILRKVLDRYVPGELFERPKRGFIIPIGRWLRGPLRDWAESLLDESRLRRQGYFRPKPIRSMWLQHVSGRRQAHNLLWDVLMFQAWLEKQQGLA